MKIGHKVRQYWHDFYYKASSSKGVEFAMRCKDAAEIVDLGQLPDSWLGRFRFRLHLSLCQACKNYFDTTAALKKVMNDFISKSEKPVQIDKLNQDLLAKYADQKTPSKN